MSNTGQKDWAENARIVRCVRAWLEENQRCECDFPDLEEDGIIYCAPCELRDYASFTPCEEHARRFGALEARTKAKVSAAAGEDAGEAKP